MQALERIRNRALHEGLHAHRAIASPLELAAREDVGARELLPPVRRGATNMPMAPRGADTGMGSGRLGGVAAEPAGMAVDVVGA